MTIKDEAWQAFCEEIMPTKRNHTYALEGAFYQTWCRAWDEAVNACAYACENADRYRGDYFASLLRTKVNP